MNDWESIKPPIRQFSATLSSTTWIFTMSKAWQNNKYIVMSRLIEDCGCEHIVICRKDSKVVSWKEKQTIKNELFGEEREAIELYPKQSELIDDQNVYHLWLLPEDNKVSFTSLL